MNAVLRGAGRESLENIFDINFQKQSFSSRPQNILLCGDAIVVDVEWEENVRWNEILLFGQQIMRT